ncbi:MAG: SMR family transporter [Candidatus Obscuribacterales bacterium]|nr:SMR family transporter [Candidatus Obscuribacterales bacterium]
MTRFYVIGFFILMVFDTMSQIGFKLAGAHAAFPEIFQLQIILHWIAQIMCEKWIYLSILGYLGAFITWMTLLKHAPIGPAFAASHLEIVSVLIFSVVFLDEKLNVVQVIGSLLILGGIFVLAAEESTVQKKSKLLENTSL